LKDEGTYAAARALAATIAFAAAAGAGFAGTHDDFVFEGRLGRRDGGFYVCVELVEGKIYVL
jgi:hypothetical protein